MIPIRRPTRTVRQKNKLVGERIKALYRDAFEYYENDKFLLSQNIIDETMAKYPDNEFEDKLMLLRAMVAGKTQSIQNYVAALGAFMKKYGKTSKLMPYAQHLLDKAAVSKTDSVAGSQKVIYNLDLNFVHYFCVVVSNKSLLKDLVYRFVKYNSEFYTEEKLIISEQTIEDSLTLVTIKTFPNKIQALNFWEKQNGKSSPLKTFPGVPFDYFVITDKNYLIMNFSKNYKSYLSFFKKNYN